MSQAPIYVTRPSMPPLAEFETMLADIWRSREVTNGGSYHQRLETALADYLEVPYVSLFANGTLALLVALRVLDIRGEVITTPFSFVATSHALLWNGNRPVFVDIDPVSLNLDPAAVEAALSPETQAILPVHVYGRPCALDAYAELAHRYGLKLIYDAAHAFGVRMTGRNLFDAGDLSVLSFHGTKVFHTFEGGAIVCRDKSVKDKIDLLKNFGFRSETEVIELGINGKMNEVQAAFGLLQLARIDEAIASRARVHEKYLAGLAGQAGLKCLSPDNGVARQNHAYFPILVEDDYPLSRDALHAALREKGIYARRYFYPLISDFPMYRDALRHVMSVAADAASRILCLPIYADMSDDDIERVLTALCTG